MNRIAWDLVRFLFGDVSWHMLEKVPPLDGCLTKDVQCIQWIEGLIAMDGHIGWICLVNK